jgi:hypothetical protein
MLADGISGMIESGKWKDGLYVKNMNCLSIKGTFKMSYFRVLLFFFCS